jgi:hypothetical protein
MKFFAGPLLALVTLLPAPPPAPHGPAPLPYTADGSFPLPKNYREWIFLSSGIDMVYGPKASETTGHSAFDNVFVNPDAYASFLRTGAWPDKTVLVLEIRAADTKPSINHGGHSQGGINGIEIHLKDAARFPGKWAFFDVKPSGLGTLIPQPATCYTCHTEHAAVDTTFVQFYPTLLPVARSKATLSPAYLKEFGPDPISPPPPTKSPNPLSPP